MTGVGSADSVGTAVRRLDGPLKVTGNARYAAEQPETDLLYAHLIQSTVARGRVASIETSDAEAVEGVAGVLTQHNAPALASTEDPETRVLQSDEIAYRGQIVAVVLAENAHVATQAANLVRVEYEESEHDVELPDGSSSQLVDAGLDSDVDTGGVDEAWESADARVDMTCTTPLEHNNPMEPHATVATWADGQLTLHDSTQGVHATRSAVEGLFGLEHVRVISPYVGGGFGSKGLPHAPLVAAGLAAMAFPGRAVKVTVTRQQMFTLVGHRPATVQRLRLAADHSGLLVSTSHDIAVSASRVKDYIERAGAPSGTMYASPQRRIRHRKAELDLPAPTWMRAPGECPGMFGLEVAVDELAEQCGMDPIDFRVRNEPDTDPSSGLPFSSRNLVQCLQVGAERFGWGERSWRRGRAQHGIGVASAAFPAFQIPGSRARIVFTGEGYRVEIGAADIGTGTWTALAQIAADALKVPLDDVDLRIGDTALPKASLAGGSSGLASWGGTVTEAAREFRDEHGKDPVEGAETTAKMPRNPDAGQYSMHAFGAQFAEVRVDTDTGEIRVPRMLGVFAAGRIVNPRTARSQLVGGMTMGVSMALHEHSVLDSRFGHVVNHDFAGYHIASNADVGDIEATWVEEDDPHVNSVGVKGIGEVGIVGAAPAIANAAYAATGIRVRDLPITLDAFLR